MQSKEAQLGAHAHQGCSAHAHTEERQSQRMQQDRIQREWREWLITRSLSCSTVIHLAAACITLKIQVTCSGVHQDRTNEHSALLQLQGRCNGVCHTRCLEVPLSVSTVRTHTDQLI